MLNRSRGAVYQTDYHLVFHTKYQKKVLLGKVSARTQKLLMEIAQKQQSKIADIKIMPNHVHILISIPLQESIPNVVKHLKGASSRYLFQEFPSLHKELRKGHLWAPSYFVRATGNVTMGTVKKYIKEQEKKHGHCQNRREIC